mmetsp:Transcript_17863/g.37336  ORF Transcript_17863/g.37336 Transcript_17863/m.37336 type:complete len:201 (+) Transcript_17863:718-1320(+)
MSDKDDHTNPSTSHSQKSPGHYNITNQDHSQDRYHHHGIKPFHSRYTPSRTPPSPPSQDARKDGHIHTGPNNSHGKNTTRNNNGANQNHPVDRDHYHGSKSSHSQYTSSSGRTLHSPCEAHGDQHRSETAFAAPATARKSTQKTTTTTTAPTTPPSLEQFTVFPITLPTINVAFLHIVLRRVHHPEKRSFPSQPEDPQTQ